MNPSVYADALVAFEPDVLVVAMGADFPTYYLKLLEAKWPAGKRRPSYVLTDLNYQLGPMAAVLGAQDEDLRRRLSGTRPAYDAVLEQNIRAYEVRYKQANNFLDADGNHSGYEAFYAMAYAVAASRAAPTLDGPAITSGFLRLRSGTLVDVGPGALGVALTLLGEPQTTVDLRGLWSGLDWNPSTRDLETDVSMYCFERDGGGNLVLKPDAGPRLSTATGAVTGAYACD